MDFEIANLVFNIGSSNSKDWVDIFSAFAPIIIGLITICIAIYANCLNNKNLKQQIKQFAIQLKEERKNLNIQLNQQKKQWLNEAYIKHEAEIILEFRELLYKSEKAFFWFADILKPYKIMTKMFPSQDVYLKKEQLFVKFSDYCKNYDIINNLNNFYNNNQMLLKKNGIEEEFIYVIAILSTCAWLNNTKDFLYTLVEENESCIKYKLNIIDKIGQLFVSTIEQESNIQIKYTEKILQTYVDNIMGIYHNLTHKLDKIITYYDGDLPDNCEQYKAHSYPSSCALVASINNNLEERNDL